MAIRTISLKDEAYSRLRGARRYPTESFSEVVLRARWPEDTVTGRALLNRLREGALFSDEELRRVADLKHRDRPPKDKWAAR